MKIRWIIAARDNDGMAIVANGYGSWSNQLETAMGFVNRKVAHVIMEGFRSPFHPYLLEIVELI